MNSLIALSMPGGMEWFFIIGLVVLLFGAKKLPELARGLGQSFGEFRRAKDEFDKELQKSAEDPAPKKLEEPAAKQPHDPTI